jgi:hypothetical protein
VGSSNLIFFSAFSASVGGGDSIQAAGTSSHGLKNVRRGYNGSWTKSDVSETGYISVITSK